MGIKSAYDMAPQGVTVFESYDDAVKSGLVKGPFKVGQPVKNWASSVEIGPYDFLGKDDKGAASLLHHATVDNFSELNMPGLFHFETWDDWIKTRAGSQVTVSTSYGSIYIPKDWLFTPDEATSIVSSSNGQLVAQTSADWRGDITAVFNYPDSEKRRVWKVVSKFGQLYDLNDLWEQQTRGTQTGPTKGTNRGVGAPGSWQVDEAGVRWLPANQDDGSTEQRYIPVPCRPLNSNEHPALDPRLTGGGAVVVITDDAVPVAGGGTRSGLTSSESAALTRIDGEVGMILQMLSRIVPPVPQG